MTNEESGEVVDGRTEETLRALVVKQEARLAEIAKLVTHVRHEINNPLTGVIGQAQLLLREELSPSVRKRVETIDQLAARIKDSVADLRSVQLPPPQPEWLSSETEKRPRDVKSKTKDGAGRTK